MTIKPIAEDPNRNTSQAELIATPQFDSGRWKLRLERVPLSTNKRSVDYSSAAAGDVSGQKTTTANATMFRPKLQ